MYTVEIDGKGAPLLMLHGWGQTHQALKPFAELLKPVARPCLVDLPGFGRSKKPDQIWSTFDYADCLVRHMDAISAKKFSVLGHSFGGKTAMCLALRYPERVDRLVLMGASGLKAHRSLGGRVKAKGIFLAGKLFKGCDRMFGTRAFKDIFALRYGSRDYNNAGEMKGILVRSVNEDLSAVIPNIQQRSLILWGEKDSETPLEMGLRLSKLIPRSTFYSFPFHGHQIFAGAGAHLCAKYMIDFLRDEG